MKSAKPARIEKASVPKEPFWRSDARARFLAFLPELVLSVVAATCMSILVCFADDPNTGALAVKMALTQVYVQAVLYVFTYLTRDAKKSHAGWVIVAASFYADLMLPLSFSGSSGSVDYTVSIAIMLGSIQFYLSRPRWGCVLLAVELVSIVASSSIAVELLGVTLIGFGSFLALYVMRGSAKRITMSFYEWENLGRGGDDEAARPLLQRTNAQVAAIGLAAGAICLAVSLVGVAVLGHSFESSDASSGSAAEVVEEGGSSENRPDVDADAVGGTQDDGAAAMTNDEDASPAVGSAREGAGRQEPHGAIPAGLIAVLLLLSLAVLSPLAKLLQRTLARRAIEREPREIDRVAKVYLGIIERLSVAGIVRRDAETPDEFLALHAEELDELTAWTGVDFKGWAALTNAYENARYADRGPTELELETAWKLYDAMPACARRKLGWARYLVSAFWRM